LSKAKHLAAVVIIDILQNMNPYVSLLLSSAAFLTLMSILVHTIRLLTGHERLLGFISLFSLNSENNLPTWFASFLLMLLFQKCRDISKACPASDISRRPWKILAFIFLLMSMDEVASMHELLGNNIIGHYWNTGGYLKYAFVIPGTFIALAVAIAFIPFLKRLPGRTSAAMVASGAIYVMATIGLESISANIADQYGSRDALYIFLFTLEEFFEMTALILMYDTLSRHAKRLP
jgi:hypothetical protein